MLVLGALPWAAYARKAPSGSAGKLFWAVPVMLVACKLWAASLIAWGLLAHAERRDRRVRVAALRRRGRVSERAGQATGHDDAGHPRPSPDQPLIKDQSR